MDIRDTSKDYDDLVGFKAKENIIVNLSEFLGEQIVDKPNIKPKLLNKDFPEDWQNLYVNFRSEKDYIDFMKVIDRNPDPKTSDITFTKEKQNGLLDFMES